MDTIISYNKKVWGHSLTWSPPGPQKLSLSAGSAKMLMPLPRVELYSPAFWIQPQQVIALAKGLKHFSPGKQIEEPE